MTPEKLAWCHGNWMCFSSPFQSPPSRFSSSCGSLGKASLDPPHSACLTHKRWERHQQPYQPLYIKQPASRTSVVPKATGISVSNSAILQWRPTNPSKRTVFLRRLGCGRCRTEAGWSGPRLFWSGAERKRFGRLFFWGKNLWTELPFSGICARSWWFVKYLKQTESNTIGNPRVWRLEGQRYSTEVGDVKRHRPGIKLAGIKQIFHHHPDWFWICLEDGH